MPGADGATGGRFGGEPRLVSSDGYTPVVKEEGTGRVHERGFAHLHLHTEYSMLDGAARIQDVIAAVVADHQPAVAMTDHGNLYGTVDFTKAATAAWPPTSSKLSRLPAPSCCRHAVV